MKYRITLPVLGIALAGVTLFGATYVNAQTETVDPQASIVQKIADTFKLDKTEVQKVFDEAHEERHAQMQARFAEKLSQAVTDGKITEAQKQAILTKFNEMKGKKPVNFESFKNMTPEQRKVEMDKKDAELKTWAESQGLSLETLQEITGFGHKGFGPGKMEIGRGDRVFMTLPSGVVPTIPAQ